jgi:adenosylcobinamide kinase/adenosylcobinamide-phosphate guanylyltransferase
MLSGLRKIKAMTIIVSNEVGLGIVPANKLARDFRDTAGRVNQTVAGASDEVYFLVSGIPAKIKRGPKDG